MTPIIDGPCAGAAGPLDRFVKRDGGVESFAPLRGWFRDKLGEPVRVTLQAPTGGNGFSGQLCFATVRSDRRDLEYVIRREVTERAIFPLADFMHEARVLQALHAQGGAAVPPTPWVEEDPKILGARFYVMRRVEGQIPQDSPHFNLSGWVAQAQPEERREMWWSTLRCMAALHRLDWRKAGLQSTFESAVSDPIRHMIEYYERTYDEFTTDPYPHIMREMFVWLERHAPTPSRTCVIWGDARLGNAVFQRTRCVCLLDWEMTGLGTPEVDLAYWLWTDMLVEKLGVPRPAGWPSHAETLELYREIVDADRASDFVFYQALAAMRVLVIHARMVATLGMPGPPAAPLIEVAQSLLRHERFRGSS
jgi:aminoglycoside phosphotransferase (APT) family kinase protein